MNDNHIRATKPRARKECDYFEECRSDLEYILNYCVKHRIKYLLCAGDFFDSANQSSRILYGMINTLNSFKDRVELITCLGNHDILNRNSENYVQETALSILEAAGCLTILHEGDYREIAEEVYVYGFGSDEDMTELFISGDKKCKPLHKGLNLALVHYPIGGAKSTHCAVTVDKCKINPKYWDLVMFGDIHDFVEAGTTDKGLNYVSNGSLCKSSIADYGRKKQFSVLSFTDKEYDHQFVEVPGLSDDDMFDVSKYEERDEKEAKAFKAAIVRAGMSQTIDPVEKVTKIADKSGFSSDAKNKVLEGVKKYV